jgi:hypothetical protein
MMAGMKTERITLSVTHDHPSGELKFMRHVLGEAFLDCRGISLVADKWILVSERLPEPNEPVLIYTEVLGRHVASVDDEGEWFCDYGGEWLYPKVTHWMPLPPAPPEVK